MGSEADQTNPSDCESLLPPRKRLLAGLKRRNSDCSLPVFEDRGGYFRSLFNSSELTNNEITESLRSAALTAAKAAVSARKIAEEKAVAAMKAKEFARRVLQLVASVSGEEQLGRIVQKGKAKLSPIDRDQTRKIFRIYKNSGESSIEFGDNESSARHTESSDGESSEKTGRILVEKVIDEDWKNPSNPRCAHNGSGIERTERKKEEMRSPSHEFKETKKNSSGKLSDGESFLGPASIWRSKKLKISQCHTKGDDLRNLCPISSVKAASALVKVD